MVRSRRSALIRLSTLLLLLWVGIDVGAHGFLASDFEPLPVPGAPCSIGMATTAASVSHVQHDHCFCHGISVGAVLQALPATLAPTGLMVVPLSSRVPRADRNPLDHPPQLTV
jgi:hypothetical protein